LLELDVQVRGAGGVPTGRLASCATLNDTLTTFDRWLEGELVPALREDLPHGSAPIATGQFIRAYRLIADRPAVKVTVDRNLRAVPEFAPFFEKHCGHEQSAEAAPNDALEKVICDATEAGHILPLAALIYPPLIEAACASNLLPEAFSDQDHVNEWALEHQRAVDQLKNRAGLGPMSRRIFAQSDPAKRAEAHREITLIEEVARAARDQLADRLGRPALPPVVIRQGRGADFQDAMPPPQAITIDVPKGADIRRLIDRTILNRPNIQQVIDDAQPARLTRRQARDTAKILAMLNRVAPRQGHGESVAPEALLSGADADTVVRIHEAIAMTIANAVNGLRGHSGRSSRIVRLPPADVRSHGTAEPGQFPLCFRTPGGASSFALEWNPPSKAVNFDTESRTVRLFDRDAAPTDVSDPVKTGLLAVVDALRKMSVTASVPAVLEAWGSWQGGECGPMPGDGVPGGFPAIPTRLFLSAFDKLVVGNPDFEDRVESNFRSHPVLSTLFPSTDDEQPANDIHPTGESGASSSSEDVDTAATQAKRQAIRHVIVRATERELYAELAATLVAPLLEAMCESGLQPRAPDERAFFWACQHQMEFRRRQLQSEARLDLGNHVRAMYGDGAETSLAQQRETILATIAACNAQEELGFEQFESLLEQDARHTAMLQWWLDCAMPMQSEDGHVAPPALSRVADPRIVSLIQNAIALTLADSINALPRYSELERSLPDAVRQFETFPTTPDPSPGLARAVLHRPHFETPSGDFPFALEQPPGSDRVNVVGPTVSMD
jgi:hypothetical protein